MQVNIDIKQEQTHRHRKQTSDYQMGDGRWDGENRYMGLRDTNYYV